jgi:hypothetical protein
LLEGAHVRFNVASDLRTGRPVAAEVHVID